MLFFPTERYIWYPDMDCLYGNNMHNMSLATALSFENCKEWCTNNKNCGGFVIYKFTCIFKNLSCKNNLYNFKGRGVSAFVKHI